MIIARTFPITLTILVLSACGSSPLVEDHYYSLVLAADDSAAAIEDESSTPRLIVGPIQLPTYLSVRGLPMQVGPNRIESAYHHFWAEPLDEAIAKVLTQDIAENTTGMNVERESGRFTAQEDCRVRLEFDAFHPTNTSRAVTSGRYWVLSKDASSRQAFSLTRTLTSDGYAHAVDVLRGILAELAQQISDEVQRNPACGVAAREDSVAEL